MKTRVNNIPSLKNQRPLCQIRIELNSSLSMGICSDSIRLLLRSLSQWMTNCGFLDPTIDPTICGLQGLVDGVLVYGVLFVLCS